MFTLRFGYYPCSTACFRGAHWTSSQVKAGLLLVKKEKDVTVITTCKILFLAERCVDIRDVSEASEKL